MNGEPHEFCCYGCCLAYQVHHGETDEPEAAALLIRLGVGAFLAMNIMLFSLLLYSGTFGAEDGWTVQLVHWLLWALATPLVIVLGGPFLRGAWQAALQRRVGTDTLVSVAVLAAYGYSALQVLSGSGAVYFDTATMVLVLFILGRYLEARARVQAARSLAPMLAAERAQARVFVDGTDTDAAGAVGAGGNGGPRPPGRAHTGGRCRLRGPVGLRRGRADRPAAAAGQGPGLLVHAGSLNGRGHLLVRATAAGSATRWVQSRRLVREALARKSSLADSVDRLAAVFLPLVVLLAAGSVMVLERADLFEEALLIGLAVLVVACPCSLGLGGRPGYNVGHRRGCAARHPHPQRRGAGAAGTDQGGRLRQDRHAHAGTAASG